MRQLIVRGVDERVVKELRARAARHGRSAEAEHRLILREALLPAAGPSLKEYLRAVPQVGEDRDFRRSRSRARRVEL